MATVAVRWPASAIGGRSRCDGCARTLRAVELIPIVSWLALRGRCGTCHARIGGLHPAIEVIGCAIGIAAGLISFIPYVGALTGLLVATCVAIAQFWPVWSSILLVPAIYFAGQSLADYVLAPYLVGRRVRELIARFRDGDVDGARAIEEELKPVIDVLAIDTNPIQVKAAVNILGLDVGVPRLPLVEATEAQKSEIRAVLERAGVLQPVQA